jgi:dTDP-4-dehydrorhamnose 3,5-epimerase
MKFTSQLIDGLVLIQPSIFEDSRGSFRRNYCADEFKGVGLNFNVCQGNISENSEKYTMRGFHYQKSPSAESKVLTPITGGIHNVVIDLRIQSSTYLKWVALDIWSKDKESLHVPAGCANAFLTLSDTTIVQYYMGDFFKPETYSGFRHDDPFFNIPWPHSPMVISDRDASFQDFSIS